MDSEADMKTMLVAVAMSALVAGPVMAQDAEKKIKMQDLPAAVQQAVKEQSKDATLRGLATEMDKGKRVYEAELSVAGHHKDITFDGEGHIVSVEEATPLAELPAPARAAIQKAATKGKVLAIETVTEDGHTFYEAQLKIGGKKSEVKVDAAGALVK
jgi:uncharacterized membrane protein YkoI